MTEELDAETVEAVPLRELHGRREAAPLADAVLEARAVLVHDKPARAHHTPALQGERAMASASATVWNAASAVQ